MATNPFLGVTQNQLPIQMCLHLNSEIIVLDLVDIGLDQTDNL